jgi:hypothetical protein
MSDHATGWVVLGVPAEDVRAYLQKHRIKAFVSPALMQRVRVFASPEDEEAMTDPDKGGRESEFTRALPGSALVNLKFEDDTLRLQVWRDGACVMRALLPPTIKRPADKDRVERELANLVDALPGMALKYDVKAERPVSQALLRSIKVESSEFSFLNFSALLQERFSGNRKEERELLKYVNERGEEEPFYVDRSTQRAPEEPSSNVPLARCRSAREWLDLRKMVDPKTASADVLEHLRLVLDRGLALQGTPDQLQVVRESGAMLLGRILQAQAVAGAREDAEARAEKSSGAKKTLWKMVVAGMEAQRRTK